MTVIINKIENFFLTQTVWIFFTVILLTSIILTFESGRHEWLIYFTFIGKLTVLFSPVLILASFRNRLRQKLHIVLLVVLWTAIFLVYPWLIEYLNFENFVARPALAKWAVRMIGTSFFLCELAILANHFWLANKSILQWHKRLNLEQGILIFIALFAVCYATMAFFISGNEMGDASLFAFISHTFQIFIILIIYYCFYLINHYFLVSRLWAQKGLVYYIFGFLATVIIFYPIAAQLIAWLPMVRTTEIHPVHNGRIFEDINALVPFYGMLMSIPFIIAVKWFRQNRDLAELEKEKSATELNLLKQQVNPHFFFNTLNNLYALSLTKDEATPEIILQLSELMRYVIYKGKEESVKIAEEVKYIEDYIKLQQIRLHKNLSFNFDKKIADDLLHIPPLLFIILVENAFKHGIEPAEGDCYLNIKLETGADCLLFSCENSYENTDTESAGIGLQNLRRRLELRFPGAHTLEFEKGNATFRAILKINAL